MTKKTISFFMILSLFLCWNNLYAEEKITITTYYPAPYGAYKKIVTETLGVGDSSGNTKIDDTDGPNPTIADQKGDVWIQGDVGIGTGTAGPRAKLEAKSENISDITAYCYNNPAKCFNNFPALTVLSVPNNKVWPLLFVDSNDPAAFIGYYLDGDLLKLSASGLDPIMEWGLETGGIDLSGALYSSNLIGIGSRTPWYTGTTTYPYHMLNVKSAHVRGATTNYTPFAAVYGESQHDYSHGYIGVEGTFPDGTNFYSEGLHGYAKSNGYLAAGVYAEAVHDEDLSDNTLVYGVFATASAGDTFTGKINAVHGTLDLSEGISLMENPENIAIYGVIEGSNSVYACDPPVFSAIYGCDSFASSSDIWNTYAGYFDGIIAINAPDDQGIHFINTTDVDNIILWNDPNSSNDILIKGYPSRNSGTRLLLDPDSNNSLSGEVRIDGDLVTHGLTATGITQVTQNWGDGVLRYKVSSGDIRYYPGFGSSLRYKDNIQPLKENFSKILKAEPKSFTYKDGGAKGIGYIAEEFDSIGLKNLVSYNESSQPESINYELISVYLLEVIKDQQAAIEKLNRRVEALEKERK